MDTRKVDTVLDVGATQLLAKLTRDGNPENPCGKNFLRESLHPGDSRLIPPEAPVGMNLLHHSQRRHAQPDNGGDRDSRKVNMDDVDTAFPN